MLGLRPCLPLSASPTPCPWALVPRTTGASPSFPCSSGAILSLHVLFPVSSVPFPLGAPHSLPPIPGDSVQMLTLSGRLCSLPGHLCLVPLDDDFTMAPPPALWHLSASPAGFCCILSTLHSARHRGRSSMNMEQGIMCGFQTERGLY